MDWDDLMCLPDRIFCRCGFSVTEIFGIGLQCYQYVGHEFQAQKIEIDAMLEMDYPRLNYWAAVCVRSMNYEVGATSEIQWVELLKKIQDKSAALRHASDEYSVVDGRYQARTRGSPPTFTHIHDDISSFIDDLQPIDSSVIFEGYTHDFPTAPPTHFVPPAPVPAPLEPGDTYPPTAVPEVGTDPTTLSPTDVPTTSPTDLPTTNTDVDASALLSPALVLSFSWSVLSWDLANNLLPFIHDFGRNTIMLKYYLEMTSWNVVYGEQFVGEYVHNGVLQLFAQKSMIHQSLRVMVHEVSRVLVDQQIRLKHDEDQHTVSVIKELQRQQRVLSSKLQLFADRSKMYTELAIDDSIDWSAINELNDTVRDVQSLIFAQTMDFEEIVRFLGCWYCSYARYYLVDEFDEYVDGETNVCVPFQHIGGLDVVEKTDKIMRFIEPLVPRVDAIKKEFGLKVTRTLMMDISDHITSELADARNGNENKISFELGPDDLILFNDLQNIKMLEIMIQFLNEHGEPLDDLEFNVSLNSPFRLYKGKCHIHENIPSST